MAKRTVEFEQVIERGCGLDVHRDTVVATVMGKGIQTETRTFGTTTRSLKALGEWLESLQVKMCIRDRHYVGTTDFLSGGWDLTTMV